MGQKRIDTKSFGFTEPAKGIGTLQFNAEVTQIQTYYVQGKRREAILGGNSLNYAFKLRLKSDPWHKTGLQPFTWDYLAPLGERLYPIIRIVASRQVEIVSELDAPLIEIKGKVLFNDLISGIKGILQPSEKFLDMPANYGRYAMKSSSTRMNANKKFPTIAPWLPLIQIIRPQHYGVMPNPESRIKTYDLIKPSYVLSPQEIHGQKPKKTNRTVLVSQHPAGVIMQQVNGLYSIDIQIKDSKAPAAFYYLIVDPEKMNESKFSVIVVSSKNVTVKVKAKKGMYDKVNVQAVKVGLSRVPFQGDAIWNEKEYPILHSKLSEKDSFGRLRSYIHAETVTFESAIREIKTDFIDLADTVLGALPIAGDIYDASQFAYAAATGEDFWGRKVDKTQLVILGASVLLPLGLKKRL